MANDHHTCSIEQINNINPLIGSMTSDTLCKVNQALAFMQYSMATVNDDVSMDMTNNELTGCYYLLSCVRAAVDFETNKHNEIGRAYTDKNS